MGYSWILALKPYGTAWRRHRRAFHEHFHLNAVHKYVPIITKETQALLRRLLETPECFMDHIRQCVMTKLIHAFDSFTNALPALFRLLS
jgi:cytochrome P450